MPSDGLERRESEGGRPALSGDELAAEAAIDLPDREAMSTIDGVIADNLAMPINESSAANVNSDYSVAISDAQQYVIVDQTDTPDPLPVDLHPGHGHSGH